MKGLILLCILLLAPALADSIYVEQRVGLGARKFRLSILPQVSQERTLHSCSVWNRRDLIKTYPLNLKLLPTKGPEVRDVVLELPEGQDLQDLRLSCDPQVKSTGWILPPSEDGELRRSEIAFEGKEFNFPAGKTVTWYANSIVLKNVKVRGKLRLWSSSVDIQASSFTHGGLIITRGKGRLQRLRFEHNKIHLTCENHCQVDVLASSFAQGEVGLWSSAGSLVKSSRNRFEDLSLAFGAYQGAFWASGSRVIDEASSFERVKVKIDSDKNSEVRP